MTPAIVAYLTLTRVASPWILRRVARDLPAERAHEIEGRATRSTPARPIWISASSIGETRAALTLFNDLSPCLITTQTPTAAALLDPEIAHQFTPADTPRAVQAFLNHWAPRVAIFVESELPPRMVRALTRRGIPFAVVGARASRTREKLPRTMALLLRQAHLITAASDEVAKELTTLGLNVAITEDLKAAIAPDLPRADDVRALSNAIGTRPVWLAASTHDGEEQAALAAHQALRTTYPDALLVLAPRHPKRFSAVAELVPDATRASRGDWPGRETRVHLVDTLGQLPLYYQAAQCTFMGGSLTSKGGHSPYEPAGFGSHVITGPDIRNHTAAYSAVPHKQLTADTLADTVRVCFTTPRPKTRQPTAPARTRAALTEILNTMAR